ncbi:PilC/PilY family type IV pilus protein [Hydrogenophaga sp.]|uniref:pilus assembly protein n=1 Tax=Hydrogenophaga sp. TaxID=1904254 RepID=UPI0026019C9D|nr:PilC/PilY family type IV pilus protein [Hydrogenophaga sp.]MDM7949943.1 PilC/PilY family type IV pilus protein [Hydrogenophaga sp.]
MAILSIAAVNLTVSAVVVWPNTPLGANISAKPMTMLVTGKDHKLFYEAYNDSSDIDGDGTLDTRFKPSITYYGLYDSSLCYSYSTTNNRFNPSATAGALGVCSTSTHWSGNWLNYMTTSRIDALRKVLYGGHRDTDTTNLTILRRAYIPQDAHSWGKEYHSVATDGYDIEDYTPLSLPSATDRRHFFGNLTPNRNVNCSTLDNCSDILPVLRIRENVGNNRRIWEWASKERPVLHDSLSSGAFPAGTGAEQNFAVRVRVCTAAFNAGCKQYPNGSYKPIGLLHEYGETDAMLFGLMTGSYDQHMSGGRLRKVVSSFADEVDANTGIFNAASPIVTTFNRLRIRDFNNGVTSGEYGNNPYNRGVVALVEGQFVDWGNPIGEMLYEATRYFAGRGAPTASFSTGTTIDGQVGLTSAAWDDPYSATSAARAPYCSRASFLTISDINPSYDSDTVPGSAFTGFGDGGQLPGFNAAALGNTITGIEDSGVSSITGQRFIGQVGATFDSAPTAKNVTSLGNIRGLAPEEPSKQGSYYSASVAYYARTNDLRPAGSNPLQGTQTIDNYVVALSSPLPKIEAALPNGRVITLVPFSKTVEFGATGVNSAKGQYQPTNQIVDFYVETIANSGPGNMNPGINGGRYYAEFQINFEDVEQGGDHDMDAIARYVIQANSDSTLSVTVIPTYQAGGMKQNMGYVISGTNRDGVYLVAKDEAGGPRYFLNVPAGESAGFCDVATPPAACGSLPRIGEAAPTFTFSPNSAGSGGATLLKDPLWYAAKYGGFVDRNGSRTPDLDVEWDADGDGVPDTYFLVQNPSTLRDSLQKAFNSILERSGSGGNVVANSTQVSSNSLVFQGLYASQRWSGELVAYPVSASGLNTTPLWRTSDTGRIPAFSARRLFYGSDTPGVLGRPFLWGELSTAEQGLLNNDEQMFNYLRGDRGRELQNGGTFRDRAANTVLGSIIHSSPAYVQDSNTVFVGANDGMLHAFDGTTGNELFGYVPSPMLSRLGNLATLAFNDNPEYFVDGDIAVSTVAQTTSNYLVATMGRGSKGIFGLDVTNPSTFTQTNVRWEYVDAADPDLGHMIGTPKIAQLTNGDWVAIVANGYNSTNEGAALYVFNLATGAVVAKLDTGAAHRGDNGLATPGLRLNGAGRVEFVYAGDLRGNVWKFDLSSTSPLAWGVANSGQPMFQARDALNNPQPITAPITTTVNAVAGDPNYNSVFVHFGTGSYFLAGDPSSTAAQTLYGLIDDNTVIPNRSNLVQRLFSISYTQGGAAVRSLSGAVSGDMTGRSGFFIDLPEAGERNVTASTYGFTTQPVMFFSSAIPQVSDCTPGGRGYINLIDPFTGAQTANPSLDANNDGNFTDETVNGVFPSSIDLGIGIPGQTTLVGRFFITGGTGGDRGTIAGGGIPTPSPTLRGRQSWREIIRD